MGNSRRAQAGGAKLPHLFEWMGMTATKCTRNKAEGSRDMAELDMSWVTEYQVVEDTYTEDRDFEGFEL